MDKNFVQRLHSDTEGEINAGAVEEAKQPTPEAYRFNNKYLVVKQDDIETVLTDEEKDEFALMLKAIRCYRQARGKKEHDYLVINTEEPYAAEVARIMTEHGHCAGPYDHEHGIIIVKAGVPHV